MVLLENANELVRSVKIGHRIRVVTWENNKINLIVIGEFELG